MIGLASVALRYGGGLEADLIREYRVRLGDAGTPRLPWRLLRSLVAGLPRGSALGKAIEGDPDVIPAADPAEAVRLWTMERELQASIFDAVMTLAWQNSGDAKAPRVTYPRPKAIDAPGKAQTQAELQAERDRVMSMLRSIGPQAEQG